MDVCLFLCNTIFVYGGIKSGTVLAVNLEEGSAQPVLIRRRRCCIVVYSRKTMCTGVVPEKMTEFQRKIAHCHKICVSL